MKMPKRLQVKHASQAPAEFHGPQPIPELSENGTADRLSHATEQQCCLLKARIC